MSLLSVTKDVCATVGVLIPQSVFSGINGNRTMQEMLSLANEMAQRISYDARDWTEYKLVATLVGDATTVSFDLPDNYKRMLLTADVWQSTSYMYPVRFIPDMNEWINRRGRNWNDAPYGEWTIFGGKIHIFPAMGAGVTASFAYLDKNCIDLNSGGVSNEFTNDADTFRLDERLLKLGMIYQWKAQKGQPYAEDMGTWGDAMTMAMAKDSPSPIIIGDRSSSAATIAYPFSVPNYVRPY